MGSKGVSMLVLKEFKGIFTIDKAFYETFKQCLSTDTTRQGLSAVYFDNEHNTFVATDGRRLIKHTPDYTYGPEFKGYYELAKIGNTYKLLPTDIDYSFPNWKRIIDYSEDYTLYKTGIRDHAGRLSNKQSSIHSIKGNMREDSGLIGNIILENKCPVNIDFITKVLKHVNTFEILLGTDEQVRPIYFIIDPNTTYMVQPMMRD